MRRTVRTFVAAGFGLVGFGIAFGLGTALTVGTGIPLLGGLINGVLVSMVLTIGLLAIDRFGSATTMWLVFGICAIPTTTLGPPGAYKVVVGIIAGLLWDSVYFGLRKKTYALFLGAVLGASSIMGVMLAALYFGFGHDAAAAFEKYSKAIYALLGMNLLVTVVGVLLGRQVYVSRLSRLGPFKNLKGEESQGAARGDDAGD